MDEESTRDPDTIKFLLLNGLEATAERFSIPKSEVSTLASEEAIHDFIIMKKVRESIVESIAKRGVKATSDEWGLNESHISFLAESLDSLTTGKSLQVNPSMFKQLVENTTNTCEEDIEEEGTIKPRKIPKLEKKFSQFTNAQKIEAVRTFVKHENPSKAAKELKIPMVNLVRWRDKIRNDLFQDTHTELLYRGKKLGRRSKFFREVDDALYSWLRSQDADTADYEQMLITKAKDFAHLDDKEPIVSSSWLKSFRKFHNI